MNKPQEEHYGDRAAYLSALAAWDEQDSDKTVQAAGVCTCCNEEFCKNVENK